MVDGGWWLRQGCVRVTTLIPPGRVSWRHLGRAAMCNVSGEAGWGWQDGRGCRCHPVSTLPQISESGQSRWLGALPSRLGRRWEGPCLQPSGSTVACLCLCPLSSPQTLRPTRFIAAIRAVVGLYHRASFHTCARREPGPISYAMVAP